jgi:YggT family protein
MIYLLLDAFVLLQKAVDWLLIALVIGVVVLVLLRVLLLQINPFGWVSYYVRRLTDPMIWPIAQHMPGNANAAPLILIIATLVGAFLFKWMLADVLTALRGLLSGVDSGDLLQIIGWVLYGVVAVLLVLIVARIVFSWLPFIRDGRLMWMLYRLTEPVMGPFRQLIPPLGMFDLSPMLLIFLLQFAQNAIRSIFELQVLQ